MRQFRIGGKKIGKAGLIGALALILAGMKSPRAFGDSRPNAQAQGQLVALVQDTSATDKLRVRADSPNRDVILACIASVFLDWQSRYLSILENTRVNPDEIINSLNDYGVFYEKQKNGLRIEDRVRKGLAGVIRDEIESRRAIRQWPAGPDAASIQLADARLDALNLNYEACTDPGFVSYVDQHVPPAELAGVDLDPLLPPFAWVQSPAGGLRLLEGKDAVAAKGGITAVSASCGGPQSSSGAEISCSILPPAGTVLNPIRLSGFGYPPLGGGRAAYDQFLNNLQGLGI